MRPASPLRPRLLHVAVLTVAGLAAPLAQAEPPPPPLLTSPPASSAGPTTAGPTIAPRAPADAKRMVATVFTHLVVFDSGAGYLHGFWRPLGSAGPDAPARLQWGRGCPEIHERVFLALHTAFANPERFFLIVDKSPDPRQAGAHCLTNVELERINPPAPPPAVAPAPAAPPAPARKP